MTRAITGLCLAAVVAVAASPALTNQAHAAAPEPLVDSLYNLLGAPSAGFVWFPRSPHIHERVTLVSTSTDLASPITSYGWDLTDFGAFVLSGPALGTTFSTPASHVVQLRITAADGRSSTVAETIHISRAAPNVMNPFPVVRIVGIDYSYGTRIRILAVAAPAGSRITVQCRGGGCRVRSVRRSVPSTRRAFSSITFRRFEGLLKPGVSLRIRVSRGTEIGAYTRFTIRRRRLPVRIDSCLDPAGIKPILCPS